MKSFKKFVSEANGFADFAKQFGKERGINVRVMGPEDRKKATEKLMKQREKKHAEKMKDPEYRKKVAEPSVRSYDPTGPRPGSSWRGD